MISDDTTQLKNTATSLLHSDWSNTNPTRTILENVQVIDYFKTEGYWAVNDSNTSVYPWPKINTFKSIDKEYFLPKLWTIEKAIKSSSIKHSLFRNFLGSSQCRCCGQNNGTGEYVYQGWKWPSGYTHYLQAHNVEPTAAFMVFISLLYNSLKQGKSQKGKVK